MIYRIGVGCRKIMAADSIVINYGDRYTKLYIHNFNEVISNHMRLVNNFFEIAFLDFIKVNYPHHKEIIDIGANIGNHSVFFAEFLDCKKVHCFEPFGTNLAILRKNVERYGEKCVIYDIALSNKTGIFPLYNSQEENYGGFSLHSYQNGSSFRVQDEIDAITLDSLELKDITMMKIDVENHENEVLEGAMNTILENKPILFIENLFYAHPDVCPDPEPHQKILHELNYMKLTPNVVGSIMDLWVSRE